MSGELIFAYSFALVVFIFMGGLVFRLTQMTWDLHEKLMARNYGEYVQGQSVMNKEPAPPDPKYPIKLELTDLGPDDVDMANKLI
jgi:hypothetical protein